MEFLFYMGDVFTPINFGLLLLGTIGGLILGATPGLSPTMAVALLIPFTFKLEPQQGLILLGAAYTSTVAGGAVSAILLKIPGAPANIATTLDGHTMALKGEGAKALQVSFLASAVGGLFGVFLLIFLTPVLAQWALAFGPSHLFWLAILGVTVIGTLDSSSVVKGLLSGCIGLWLATIGFDDIMGAQRFIFHPSVSGGINVIPALIGLFAIPQVITMFTKGRSSDDAEVITVQKHPIRLAFVEVFKRKTALVIGTLTGSIIGLILTLSIPGSPTAAVLLGGLLIHGIFPGPDLFINYPQVAWTFIDSMLIGQLLMCVFGLYIAGLAASVARVPHAVMAAVVLGLAVFGSYSVQNSMGDVYVMGSLGLAMYFLERFGFSAAPLVLGLILGPIAEANFIQGSMIANATVGMGSFFFTGWLNWLLIVIVLASISYSVWMEVMARRYTTKDDAVAKEEALS